MRRLSALLLALCLLLELAGCGEDASEPTGAPEPAPSAAPTSTQAPEPVSFRLAYDPNAPLDPIAGESQVNRDLTALVWQGLYELDNDFQPRPVLARSSRVSADGLAWTFALAEGIFFSDGTPLTADHAAASLNAARTSPMYAARLSAVTGVSASEGAVTVTLSAPNGNLPALLDVPVSLAAEGQPAPLGTGYYRVERDGEGGLRLGVNPFHFAAALPYAEIPLVPVASADERAAAFNTARVSAAVTDYTGSYAPGYSGACATADCPTTDLIYVGFRTTGGPCRSAAVRQAVARAMDRETAAAAPLAGHALASALPVSPRSPEYDAEIAGQLSYDPASAAALLDGAGYARNSGDGLRYAGRSPLALTLLVNSDSEAKQAVAALLTEELEKLGVTVAVTTLPWTEYQSALSAGNFDLYLGETVLTGDFDLSVLLSGPLNYGGFPAGGLSAPLSARRSARGEERISAASALWEEFVREVPIAPVCFKNRSLLVQWGMASNLQPTRANPFYHMEEWTATR